MVEINARRKGIDFQMEKDQERRVREGKLWPCDPAKNKRCNKRGCYYLHGGPCKYTANKAAARETVE